MERCIELWFHVFRKCHGWTANSILVFVNQPTNLAIKVTSFDEEVKLLTARDFTGQRHFILIGVNKCIYPRC